ncbi:EpsG family protein [Synechococcus sp. 8F6]|uniref:EpsG family protein n=1 Tax=Synechococcus sp. 8F6 TaxID=2025606 RepID=UPI001E45F988|nr:EpsG family protein [Synechococcus sp. 8F6]
MIPYWLLLLLPLWACVQGPRRPWPTWQAWLIGIALTLFIGLRHEVGGDWGNYIPYLTRAEGLSLAEAVAAGDPATTPSTGCLPPTPGASTVSTW